MPGWTFSSRPLTTADGLRVRTVELQFPSDAPLGAMVTLEVTMGGVVVDTKRFALAESEMGVVNQLLAGLEAWIEGVLDARGDLPPQRQRGEPVTPRTATAGEEPPMIRLGP